MKHLSIIGTTGSGKSTLARLVAQKLAVPYVELDAINWQNPNWQPITGADFQNQIAEVVRQESWVIEVGYSAVRPLIWERVDTVIWLDYSFPITFGRLLRRTAGRIVSGEQLWGGNRETLALALSRDSILLWCLKSYRRKRRQFPELLARAEYRHLRVLHFELPRQTEVWLAGLSPIAAQASGTVKS